MILIKAPPFSGKTSLATLLKYNFEKKENTYPIMLSLIRKTGAQQFDYESIDFSFKNNCNIENSQTFFEMIQTDKSRNYVLIIDEGQKLYANCNDFLEQLKLVSNKTTLKTICFAAYGKYDIASTDTTPLHFDKQRSVTLLKLRLNEFDELIKNYNGSKEGKAVPIDNSISNYIRILTDFHAGLVKKTLNLIWKKFSSYPKQFNNHDIFSFLLSKPFMFDISESRCFNPELTLTDSHKDIINEIRMNGSFLKKQCLQKEIDHMVLSGLLYSNDRQRYRFSSPLILKAYLYIYERECIRPYDFDKKDPNIIDFVYEVLSKIDSNQARLAAHAKLPTPLYEKTWNCEIYRAISKILPNKYFINIDVPPFNFPDNEKESEMQIEEENNDEEIERKSDLNGKKLGYLDFYINYDLQYGIEILREGKKKTILEHHNRFIPPLGRYSNMKFKEYVVLDIRSSPPKSKYLQNDKYVAAVYDTNFEIWTVYWKDFKKPKKIPFCQFALSTILNQRIINAITVYVEYSDLFTKPLSAVLYEIYPEDMK